MTSTPVRPDSDADRLRSEARAIEDQARRYLAQGHSTAAMIETNRAQTMRRLAKLIDGRSE